MDCMIVYNSNAGKLRNSDIDRYLGITGDSTDDKFTFFLMDTVTGEENLPINEEEAGRIKNDIVNYVKKIGWNKEWIEVSVYFGLYGNSEEFMSYLHGLIGVMTTAIDPDSYGYEVLMSVYHGKEKEEEPHLHMMLYSKYPSGSDEYMQASGRIDTRITEVIEALSSHIEETFDLAFELAMLETKLHYIDEDIEMQEMKDKQIGDDIDSEEHFERIDADIETQKINYQRISADIEMQRINLQHINSKIAKLASSCAR